MLGLVTRAPYQPAFAPRASVGALLRASVGARVRVAGRTGSDFQDDLTDAKNVGDVDRLARAYLEDGNVPRYIAKDWWVPVTIKENGHTLETLWAPDYGAVGTNADPFRLAKTTEGFAQDYADAFDALLPSQKLLRAAEAQAQVKIAYIPVQKGGGADDSVQAVITANTKAQAALDKVGAEPDDGKLKIGYKKSYVVRPNLDGAYIAIYGGRWTPAGGLVQPTSGHAHTEASTRNGWAYSDYSHGIALVSRKAKLDGDDVDLRTDVFGSKDPSIYGLVSDEGRFDPVFPNAGGGSLAKFSVTSDAPASIAHTGTPAGQGSGGLGGWTVPVGIALAMGLTYALVG